MSWASERNHMRQDDTPTPALTRAKLARDIIPRSWERRIRLPDVVLAVSEEMGWAAKRQTRSLPRWMRACGAGGCYKAGNLHSELQMRKI